jgi:hypothetical protein
VVSGDKTRRELDTVRDYFAPAPGRRLLRVKHLLDEIQHPEELHQADHKTGYR